MFNQISWQNYFIVVAITITIYYLYVGIRYYSKELTGIFSGTTRLKLKSKGVEVERPPYAEEQPEAFNDDEDDEMLDDEFIQSEQLVGRLKNVISAAPKESLQPDEVENRIRTVLNDFPAIKDSVLRSSVNELIVSECEKYGAADFAEDEVDLMW